VTEEFSQWNDVPVSGLLDRCDEYLEKVTIYQNACKKLTREFKEFAAYNDLRNLLEN
jgi:hypothetical protein